MLDFERSTPGNGVYSSTIDFYTESFVIQATLKSPEKRLSDHLNSSVSTVDVKPISALQKSTEIETDLSNCHAHITKSRILFVVPVAEPERPVGADNTAWRATDQYRAWGGAGSYTFRGSLHADSGRDPQIALRLLDKQFVPFTGVSITFPDGTVHSYSTIIVNRQHLDFLALERSS